MGNSRWGRVQRIKHVCDDFVAMTQERFDVLGLALLHGVELCRVKEFSVLCCAQLFVFHNLTSHDCLDSNISLTVAPIVLCRYGMPTIFMYCTKTKEKKLSDFYEGQN